MQLLMFQDFQFRYRYIPDIYGWRCGESIELNLYNGSTYVCYSLFIRPVKLYVGSSMLDYSYWSRDFDTTSIIIHPVSKLVLLSRYVPIEVRRLLFKERVIAAVLVAGATHEYFEGILGHMEDFY